MVSRINLRPRREAVVSPTRRSFRITAHGVQRPTIIRPPPIETSSPVSVSSDSSDHTLSSQSSESSESSDSESLIDISQEDSPRLRLSYNRSTRAFCNLCGLEFDIHELRLDYRSGDGANPPIRHRHLHCAIADGELYFPRGGEEAFSFEREIHAMVRRSCLDYLRDNLRPEMTVETNRLLPLGEGGGDSISNRSSLYQTVRDRQLFHSRFGSFSSEVSTSQIKGLRKDILSSLPRLACISHSKDEICCVICLDDLKAGQTVVRLPCFHQFHEECIVEWLKCSKLCPIDKMNLEEIVNHT